MLNEYVIHISIILGATIIGVFIFDACMEYLQSKNDPWRISLTNGQVNFQFLSLLVVGCLGYSFGYHIGLSLPMHQIDEPFVLGGMFSLLCNIINRGYTMLHFHRIKVNKEDQKVYSQRVLFK